jgi:hypothetical protein
MAGLRQAEKPKDPGVRHLFSSIGFLDDSYWQRAYWVLGPKMWIGDAGLSGWNLEALTHPFGRILAVDEKQVYGFGRDDLGGGYSGGHVGLQARGNRRPSHYRLFAADHEPPRAASGASEPAGQTGRAGAGDSDSNETVNWSPRWARSVPLLVRAMAVGEESLFVAGPPDGDITELGDALAGRKGGLLMVVGKSDGKTLAEFTLDATPVFDGMAAGGGRLYLSCTDSRLRCFEKK